MMKMLSDFETNMKQQRKRVAHSDWDAAYLSLPALPLCVLLLVSSGPLLCFTPPQVVDHAFSEVPSRGQGNGPLARQQPVLRGQSAELRC